MAETAARHAAKSCLVKQTVEGGFHNTITCDLEINLMTSDLFQRCDLDKVPLAGNWAVEVERREDIVEVAVVFHDVPPGRWGPHVRIIFSFFYTMDGQQVMLEKDVWARHTAPSRHPKDGTPFDSFMLEIPLSMLQSAGASSSSTYDPGTHCAYRLVLGLHSEPTKPSSEAGRLIKRMPGTDLSAVPHNVRLFFPHYEADLWSDSTFLSHSSPYFKTLLSSDFAEAVTMPSKRRRTRRDSTTATAVADADSKDFDDSDDETDELYFKAHSPSQHEHDELQHPYKEIKITKTAFTTYRAVLAYLRTGFIAFAPLSSTFSSDADAAAPTRASRIKATVSSDPTLPYPVSPKSTFRLAHLLELDELQHLCLANLTKQLTIACAPYELFSDTSVCYDAWRKVVLDFVVDNYDAVTASKAWEEMEGKVERDEVEGAAPIMLELFKRRPFRTTA